MIADDDSRYVYTALEQHFPGREIPDLTTPELSYLLCEAQKLKRADRERENLTTGGS